jgi:Ras family
MPAEHKRDDGRPPPLHTVPYPFVPVYDVTRPETLDGLADKWLPEFRAHATRRDAVTMVVGNKTDLTTERVVAAEAGAAFARAQGCLYREVSAKADAGGVHDGVYDALMWGMVSTILDAPGLLNAAPPNDTGTRVRVRDGGSRGRSGCC